MRPLSEGDLGLRGIVDSTAGSLAGFPMPHFDAPRTLTFIEDSLDGVRSSARAGVKVDDLVQRSLGTNAYAHARVSVTLSLCSLTKKRGWVHFVPFPRHAKGAELSAPGSPLSLQRYHGSI